jgi:hypothetical protein
MYIDKRILNLKFFVMKALSNGLHTFMTRMIDGKFSRHIMNTYSMGDSLAIFMMWIADGRFVCQYHEPSIGTRQQYVNLRGSALGNFETAI